MGSIRTCLLQEDTLYGVRKDLSLTRIDFIWGQLGLVCCKKTSYMGLERACLLQEDTLYGVNKDLSVTRIHVIWDQ